MSNAETLALFFERPFEPVFTPRNGGKMSIEVPESFLSDRYKNVGADLQNRFGGSDVKVRIPVLEIKQPDLSFAYVIPKSSGFSLFVKKHIDIAGRFVKILLDQPDMESLISVLAYAKDRLNPYLFQYSLAVAIAHRRDTRMVQIPPVIQTFPDQFVEPGIFPQLREEATLVSPENRRPIEIPVNFTASDREEEQRLAFWREDIGVNAHHWHWHLVYPGGGDPAIVNKDRRGELFYYMHSQILARYNVERFGANLARVKRFSNFREIIPEGYYPKMVRSFTNRAYPPRASNSVLHDVDREETSVEVADLERWRDRVLEAIDQGYIVASNGEHIPFAEDTGISLLGDIMESSQRSPNPQLYGSLHNEGHNVIAFCHDPDYRHLEDYSVIGDNATAMRDPLFYKWHAFIDFVFVRYKLTLPPYTDDQLIFNGIDIENAQIIIRKNTPPNTLLTYWQKSLVDLQTGLDFGPQGNLFAQFTHLQHAPFNYQINVSNISGTHRRGTCRIFIGPKSDERGIPLLFRDQRLLMIELDKFTVNLKPGSNTIVRRSDESSVTIPFERTFRPIGVNNIPQKIEEQLQFQFCGCGWPQHMLIPKGKPEGMDFDLFVMISDFTLDTVNQDYNEKENCNDAASYCGLRDMLYPDRRPMGYPFDRFNEVRTLADMTSKGGNMTLVPVQVKFSNAVVNRNS